jgi:hypothetical protein
MSSTRTKHILDKLVGEAHRDTVISFIQICLYFLSIAILFVVLYLLLKKVIPVTNKILPLVNLSVIPNVTRLEPIISDVTDTILSKEHIPTNRVSKVVWDALYTDSTTGKPYTEVGTVMKDVADIEVGLKVLIDLVKNLPHFE